MLQWSVQRAATTVTWDANLESRSQFGLKSATRLHEAGIASNRAISHGAVNTFPGLVHTARQAMEAGVPEVGCRKALPRVKLVTGAKS